MVYAYIYIFFFRVFSILGYCKILNIVLCAMQCILVVYLFIYSSVGLLISNLPPSPLAIVSLCPMSVSLFLFCK